jgi:uncharacterized membrane protein YhhN
MRFALSIFPILLLTVFLLICAEIAKKKKYVYILKPISTLLVIVALLLSFCEPTQKTSYSFLILMGLLFSFGGDIALMFQQKRRYFALGLVLFLLAHIVYTIVFSLFDRFSTYDIISGIILLAVAFAIYTLIKSNLGTLRISVMVYIIVISVMVNRAISTFDSSILDFLQAVMIASGALLFYISDIILAADRYWKRWKYNRISLAFYYIGQFLIALSASYFK